MTRLNRLRLRQSELRQKIGALLDTELEKRSETFDADLTKLSNEARSLETELQAALIVEPDAVTVETRADTPDRETRELAELTARASAGAIYAAALEQRSTDGATLELQQHYGLGFNQVPLAMLETRAVTPAPTNTGASQQAILLPVFAEGDAAYLGVDMPTVPVGDAVFPVLTNRPTVGGPHTGDTLVAETTGTFESDVLVPGRIQASYFYLRTDRARFAGMDEALRQALNSGLSEALDVKVIAQIVTDVTRTAVSAADSFASYRKRLVYDVIDGRFASVEGDVRVLVGSPTLANMSGLYRGNSADDSAVDSIRRIAGGLRVSPHIAAVAGSKQDAIVRRGSRADAVAPLWDGVTLIPDEVTKAGNGEIVITAVLLAAFKVIRDGGFKRVHTQHA